MSRAEQRLAAADTGGAPAAEREAVAVLQRVFARGRYLLRAFAARSRLAVTTTFPRACPSST